MNLVFASGFLLPQHLLGINYFRGLPDHLAQTGVKALFPQVPPSDRPQSPRPFQPGTHRVADHVIDSASRESNRGLAGRSETG